jgi:hypothetical protein
MPANNEYPLYNGIAPSWADSTVKISGTDIVLLETRDIAGINTSRSVEVGEQRSGGRVIKRTSGDASQEGSLNLYRDGYQKMLRTLMNAAIAKGLTRGNKVLISLVAFDIQYLHTPPGATEIFDRRVRGCRVIGDTVNGAEGTEADKVEVPLSVIEIVDMIDGKEVVLL